MIMKQYNINELLPANYNPRKNLTPDDREYQKIKTSIETFGYVDPIIINKDKTIIGGHQRLNVLRDLGYTDIDVIEIDIDKTKEKALNVALNKISGEWDIDKLGLLLNELKTDNFDLDITGFDADELDGILFNVDELDETVEDDYEAVLPTEPKAKLGDIYQLGNHRLMCGDSTSIDDVEKLMNGVKADMVFTDPPYNVAFNGRSGNFDVIKNDDLNESEFEDFINATINAIKYINAPIYYIWCNWKFYGILQGKLDYKSCIVWAKNVFGLGNGYRHQHEFCLFNGTIDEEIKNESDLWEIAKDTNYVHPTQKPIALCGRALKNHKNVKNVLDLFGGSGSTLIACEQLNRNCYMMELDPRYIDVIIDRWETFTGQTAIKI